MDEQSGPQPPDQPPDEGAPHDGTHHDGTLHDGTLHNGTADVVAGVGRRRSGRHRSAAVIGVLTLLLGFAIAVQVHASSSTDALGNLSENDLVSILDNQDDRAQRLHTQIASLQRTLRQLQTSGDASAAARQEASQQAAALGVLLGTVPATGPGVVVTIADPHHHLGGGDVLAVVEELRGAGAEAIQVGPVRVTTTTAFTGSGAAVAADGTRLTLPYTIRAIGPAATMATALDIPGGVAAGVRTEGGTLSIAQRRRVLIEAVRTLPSQQYVHPGR